MLLPAADTDGILVPLQQQPDVLALVWMALCRDGGLATRPGEHLDRSGWCRRRQVLNVYTGSCLTVDTGGWVYTNDSWLDPHPVPLEEWRTGGMTRRRRWIRRIYFNPISSV